MARDHFEYALVSTNVEPAIAGRMRSIMAEVYDGEVSTGWTDVLRDHLVAIGRRAQAHGAHVVVLTYPFMQSPVEDAQRAAADDLGAVLVDVRKRFDRELEGRPREELFVKDGHCSDAGYRIVAEQASDCVAALLRDQ